jgi:YidC/Oxa1 family membrane protein insertase
MTDNNNLLLAIVLSAAVFFGWEYFVVTPQMNAQRAAQAHLAHPQAAEVAAPGLAPAAPGVTPTISRVEALKADGARIAIDTPTVDGTLRLKGARFDDLKLKNYRETVDPKSPEIVLLSPQSAAYPYYVVFGWVAPPGSSLKTPDDATPWTLASGTKLTPGSPVTLKWDNGQGLVFRRTIAVDDKYMFTVSDTVTNSGGGKQVLYPYAYVLRHGVPKTVSAWVLHEGFVGVASGSAQYTKYDGIKVGESQSFDSTGGWLGITDKYWMAAVIPPQNDAFTGEYKVSGTDAAKSYQSDYRLNAVSVAPGGHVTVTNRLFAGAKIVSLLGDYQTRLGIAKFDLAVDWGWFWFFTRPIFYLLDLFYRYIGNFGLAILLLTVVMKGLFFPLADASYRSMSKMKKLQPDMERIKERFAEDKVRQQQEIMELYKREKVNPVSGCLPMLIQIPVFFSLYKVLYVTIEMRHAPFFGWIHDLSAADPTNFLNLFGLLPYSIPSFVPLFLCIGVWPMLMGISQWVTTKLNPAPADPVQAQMFTYMPLIFTALMANFASGLVIYWTWNNILTGLQQYAVMRRQGVEIHLFKNLSMPAFLRGLLPKHGKDAAPGE